MRKMLEELKKLDAEVNVPENFSKKVMERIKNDNATQVKEVKSKVSYLRKYVIPWTSAVAVLLIVALVTIDGTVRDKSSTESINTNVLDTTNTPDKSTQTDNKDTLEIIAIEGATINEAIKGDNSIFDSWFGTDDSVDTDFIVNDKNAAAVGSEKEESKSEIYRGEDILTLDSILNLLKNNGLKCEIEADFIVVNSENVEKIKDILDEIYENIELIQEENIIKIKLK